MTTNLGTRHLPLVKQAHQAIKQVLKPGDIAVDATVGNGYDTCFLAQIVGHKGCVFGFDIQHSAITTTRQRLQQYRVDQQVKLFQASHDKIAHYLPSHYMGKVTAAMFNLGYLPGSDKTIITQMQTTLPAIKNVWQILAQGGRLSLLAYPGHRGGDLETEAVRRWVTQLNPAQHCIITQTTQQQYPTSPILIVLAKKSVVLRPLNSTSFDR